MITVFRWRKRKKNLQFYHKTTF